MNGYKTEPHKTQDIAHALAQDGAIFSEQRGVVSTSASRLRDRSEHKDMAETYLTSSLKFAQNRLMYNSISFRRITTL